MKERETLRFRGQPVLVTGASSGLGRALATELGLAGAKLTLAARRGRELERLAERIRAAGGRAQTTTLDLRQTEDAHAALVELDQQVGGFELVVANAGVGARAWAGALRWEDCRNVLDVNVYGAVATLLAVMPGMIRRRRGHLAAVTSMAGVRATPHNAVYGASKAFLRHFLDGLRIDLEPSGIAVTEIRPGFVRTPMVAPLDGPKPFMVEPSRAARLAVRGLADRRAIVAFPRRMAALTEALRLMPRPVYERAMRQARPAETSESALDRVPPDEAE